VEDHRRKEALEQLVSVPRWRRLEDDGEMWRRRTRNTLLNYSLSHGALCKQKALIFRLEIF
jgi:hypothetical protein